jgi:ATP-binding protein involved in chromosome partitioning
MMSSPSGSAGRRNAPPSVARHAIAIASGKGGVGKSTVSLNLAVALSDQGMRVGLMDADLYGPDIPRMIGLARTKEAKHLDLWRADGARHEPYERFGVSIMSIGFLVGEGQSISMQAGLVDLLLGQLLTGVAWGELDYLIVDLPPGTADLQQQLMARLKLSGAIVVVTPQDVAHLDARKVLDLCKRASVPVLGGIENMDGLVCPGCDERIDVFPRVAEDRSIWSHGVVKLGAIPLDPSVASAGDRGTPIVRADPGSAQAKAFADLAARMGAVLRP